MHGQRARTGGQEQCTFRTAAVIEPRENFFKQTGDRQTGFDNDGSGNIAGVVDKLEKLTVAHPKFKDHGAFFCLHDLMWTKYKKI
jgi:hypothetical protein